MLLERRGDEAGAEAAYRRADERGHAAAAAHLGALLERLRNRREPRPPTDARIAVTTPRARFVLAACSSSRAAEACPRRVRPRGRTRGYATQRTRSASCWKGGRTSRARAAYVRAVERGDAAAAFRLGVLLEEMTISPGAEAAYRRAAQHSHAGATSGLGVLLERRGTRPRPRRPTAVAGEAGDPAGAYNLGVLLEGRGGQAGASSLPTLRSVGRQSASGRCSSSKVIWPVPKPPTVARRRPPPTAPPPRSRPQSAASEPQRRRAITPTGSRGESRERGALQSRPTAAPPNRNRTRSLRRSA